MTGRTVSHYEILDKLGSGGMGVVYRAHDVRLDRTVALKFLSTGLGMSEQDHKRFVSEAKASSALDHPNIGVVFDIEETSDGQTFIVMAYYPGQTLKERIAARPPLEQSLTLAIQIAQGLAKAHAHGIVHRDLKPSNIVVTADGVPKIIDFGLALVSDATLSMTASTKGTPAYMSPEQTLGEDVDARTDLWALGVILYEMLTGTLPFPGSSSTAILYEVVHHEPIRPGAICAGIDPEIERIVMKALAKKRQDLYSSADEMVRDLSAFQSRMSAPLKTPLTKRKSMAATAGLAIVIAGGAFLGVGTWRRGRQEAAAERARLIRDGQFPSAFLRAQAAGKAISQDQW